MSMTTQAFLSLLSQGVKSSANVSRKVGEGKTRKMALRAMPKDLTDEEIVHTAKVHGCDASETQKVGDDIVKNGSGKELYGAAAEAIACDVLGVPQPVAEKPRKGRKDKDAGEPAAAEPSV